ncbi:MAG TPA: cyclic-di-AMP-binding protein CbpB [Alloiococcus sp.]|nr:cyclic-di-AMP-binding protein CbpB [Alloiococcus sp.]
MISSKLLKYFVNDRIQLVKDADRVAVMYSWHKLDHAMLILSSDMYNVVPVLNRDSQVVGLISMARIARAAIQIEGMSFDNLNEMTVGDVMDQDVFKIKEDFEFEDVLKMLVDTSFICVVDDQDVFKGIITRSDVLRGTNHLVHNLESAYDLVEKE